MSSHTSTLLSVNDLALEAGPLRLCENLSFTLRTGEGLILRGANGSGKTSLLRAIAGLGPIAQGSVRFGTHNDPNAYNLAENCHYIAHKNGLKAVHSVRQNLDFFAQFDTAETPRQMSTNDAARALDITRLLDLPVRVLSAGQMRRAALARLLITQRPIWLLDEPSAALDTHTTEQVESLSRAHLDAGGMIIASTHLPFLSDHPQCQTLNMSDYAPSKLQEVQI